jgi:hypothetical protein
LIYFIFHLIEDYPIDVVLNPMILDLAYKIK